MSWPNGGLTDDEVETWPDFEENGLYEGEDETEGYVDYGAVGALDEDEEGPRTSPPAPLSLQQNPQQQPPAPPNPQFSNVDDGTLPPRPTIHKPQQHLPSYQVDDEDHQQEEHASTYDDEYEEEEEPEAPRPTPFSVPGGSASSSASSSATNLAAPRPVPPPIHPAKLVAAAASLQRGTGASVEAAAFASPSPNQLQPLQPQHEHLSVQQLDQQESTYLPSSPMQSQQQQLQPLQQHQALLQTAPRAQSPPRPVAQPRPPVNMRPTKPTSGKAPSTGLTKPAVAVVPPKPNVPATKYSGTGKAPYQTSGGQLVDEAEIIEIEPCTVAPKFFIAQRAPRNPPVNPKNQPSEQESSTKTLTERTHSSKRGLLPSVISTTKYNPITQPSPILKVKSPPLVKGTAHEPNTYSQPSTTSHPPKFTNKPTRGPSPQLPQSHHSLTNHQHLHQQQQPPQQQIIPSSPHDTLVKNVLERLSSQQQALLPYYTQSFVPKPSPPDLAALTAKSMYFGPLPPSPMPRSELLFVARAYAEIERAAREACSAPLPGKLSADFNTRKMDGGNS
ncbi:hypothetical protein Pelo_6596 [Pelomyxa schiedti]|nr:hypothetical protein Pelo_6596 [Pelomyxa schiedti]